MRIEFKGLAAVVDVPDCPAFLDTLRAASTGWPFAETARTGAPVAEVRRTDAGYELLSPWHEEPTFIETSAVRAAGSIVVDVVTSYIAENPSRLCLHCGSAVIGDRLVVFPSQSRAGKSTLIARLAAEGFQIYGDDVLPLDEADARGVSLGLAPRLRLPLPASASLGFRSFVEENAGPSDGYYQYLALPEDGLAPCGSAMPLGAVVLLDRRPAGSARIGPARRADSLKALIKQNVARGEPARELLDRLHRLMDRLACFTLSYSDLDEAVALIGRTFSTWPPVHDPASWSAGVVSGHPEGEGEPGAASEASLPPEHDGRRWRRNPAVQLRIVDGEAFLIDAGDSAIHHLNAIGTGLWNLLADDIDRSEAAEVLLGAFPDAARDAIERDVTALLEALYAAGLVLPDEGPTTMLRD